MKIIRNTIDIREFFFKKKRSTLSFKQFRESIYLNYNLSKESMDQTVTNTMLIFKKDPNHKSIFLSQQIFLVRLSFLSQQRKILLIDFPTVEQKLDSPLPSISDNINRGIVRSFRIQEAHDPTNFRVNASGKVELKGWKRSKRLRCC